MNVFFTAAGWDDYVHWQTEDRKTLKKINDLTKRYQTRALRRYRKARAIEAPTAGVLVAPHQPRTQAGIPGGGEQNAGYCGVSVSLLNHGADGCAIE
jgi:hypothetical protein